MSASPSRLGGLLAGFCRAVDTVNEKISWLAAGAVLAACLISAGNAVVRYAWDTSSNGWLEIQWYLFALTVKRVAYQVCLGLRRVEV